MNGLELTVRRTTAAPRKTVFDAWLSPAMMAKFMTPPSGGAGPSRVTTNPVKGGRFSIVMITPEKEVPHAGTYLEIDPHSRLAFTWESPHSLPESVVTIDFAEPAPGTTELTLTHVTFRSEESRDGHEKGWTAIVGNLADILA